MYDSHEMYIPECISIRFFRFTSSLLLGWALLFTTQSSAQEPTVESVPEEQSVLSAPGEQTVQPVSQEQPAQPATEEQPVQSVQAADFLDPVDVPRDFLSGQFVSFVSDIDRFFGDDLNYQESNKSVLQLDITRLIGRGTERKFVLSGRAKVHLPSVEKRMHLVLESNPDKNLSGEAAQGKVTPIDQVAAPESYAAAARYENEAQKIWHSSADAGIKLQGVNTTPFAKMRGSLAVAFEPWRLKVAETLFWFNTTGSGESTQIDLDHQLSESLLFRASTNSTWLMKNTSADWHQDLSIYHTLEERSALLYQVSAIGVNKPQWRVMEYVALLNYRYRLHRNWIFIELSPQLHYPQTLNYRVSPLLSMRLELLLDGPK